MAIKVIESTHSLGWSVQSKSADFLFAIFDLFILISTPTCVIFADAKQPTTGDVSLAGFQGGEWSF